MKKADKDAELLEPFDLTSIVVLAIITLFIGAVGGAFFVIPRIIGGC